ncbi:MAG: tyrosine-type recombinase/integrase [Pseudomonadota bacterium]
MQLLNKYKLFLIEQDLSPISIKGYIYDIGYFDNWVKDFYQTEISLDEVSSNDIHAYREYLLKIQRRKPTTINRRIQSLKRFYSWLLRIKQRSDDPTLNIRFIKRSPNKKPESLTKAEVHALLTMAGRSNYGLDKRNYALVQLLLQSGLRVSEVASLQIRDLVIKERSGFVTVVEGKGKKNREVALNATARRAISNYLDTKKITFEDEYLFTNKSKQAITIRALQKIIKSLAEKANITRIKVSVHTLRHTFATHYLQANPSKLADLAVIMGHESIDTTTIYTKPSKTQLAESIERSGINIYGN